MMVSQVEGFGTHGHLPVGGTLPLICPQCLSFQSQEQLLDVRGSCPSCGVRYPFVDGIPVLLTDRNAREALKMGTKVLDVSTRCYQEYDNYWRPHLSDGLLKQAYELAQKRKEKIADSLPSATAGGLEGVLL